MFNDGLMMFNDGLAINFRWQTMTNLMLSNAVVQATDTWACGKNAGRLVGCHEIFMGIFHGISTTDIPSGYVKIAIENGHL